MNKTQRHNVNDTFLADWMAGKISDKELQKLVSSDDFETYKKILIGVDTFEKPSFDIQKGLEDITTKIKEVGTTKVRKILPNWFYAVAATLVLFFGIAQFFNTDKSFRTGFGEQKNLLFKDGSSAYLNANSTIKYAKNWNKNREVYLEGEAFFQVAKGDDFKVQTPQGEVRILGTTFNVISREGFFEVKCYEGKVSVLVNDEELILTAGKAWRMITDYPNELWNLNLEKPTWLSGESNFKSVPIQYVLQAIENQFQVQIQTTNIEDQVIFTGGFGHQNLEAALQSISLPLNLEFNIIDRQTVVLSKK